VNFFTREETTMNVRDLSLNLTSALLRSSTQETPEQQHARQKTPFSIAISREVGALGTSVATELGNRLGWSVYDQELIHKIAEEFGKPSARIRSLDERSVSWLEEFVNSLASEYHVTPTAYFRKLVGVVHGLGVIGKCVLVGRGSSFLLPRESTLRARLVANLPDRVATIRQLKGLSEKEAERFIETTQHDRLQFLKKHFAIDAADPHHYDLVLNMSFMGVEDAADVIIHTLHRFEQRREANIPHGAEAVARV